MSLKHSEKNISTIGSILRDVNLPIGQRFRALFTLRNIGGNESIDEMSGCLLKDDSVLLKHECAYCLGQMQDNYAINVLNEVLSNTTEHPMVRHEAGEALGAIASQQSLVILKKFANDSSQEVSETCLLAIQRIEYLLNETKENAINDSLIYKSVDPAPPLLYTDSDISKLESILINPKNELFSRYRAMFALRNINSNESAIALANGLKCSDSALFRHEIAYVLGQMQNPSTVKQLAQVLENFDENEMVRHECAEALGAIATEEANQVLQKYITDDQRVVRESVEVALDMSDYNNSSEFQYANALNKVSNQ